MDNNFNYYELLGVKENATEDEIKNAYKIQMKKWHPDINKSNDAVNMSQKINEAKEVLLDSVKRKDYDEYLSKKINENYNRYTQTKNTVAEESQDGSAYEDEKVTKWQYLKDWLKYGTVSPVRKTIGLIGVLLESLICFLIKCVLIILSYIAFYCSYFIRLLYGYISPIIGLLALLFIGMCLTNGFKQTISDSPESLNAIIIISVIYVISYILPVVSKALLSPRVFNFLYNKIDINLFKKCVGYKD